MSSWTREEKFHIYQQPYIIFFKGDRLMEEKMTVIKGPISGLW